MKFMPNDPPRMFAVPSGQLADCAHIQLEPNEQVTFLTESGAEYDVVRTSWGYYATPSLNGRLESFDLRAVLVKNSIGRYYVWLVERGKEADCERYLERDKGTIVHWLDSTEELDALEQKVRSD
jgi:hypothetical protein